MYEYDAHGWLTNRVDALGRSTRYGYNNAGQLTNVDYATDMDVTYAYDSLGRQTSRTDAAGTWAWTYDGESSRILSETLTSDLWPPTSVLYSYAPDTYALASIS